MSTAPRVTLGVATYARDAYLAEAISSCLAQDYDSLEVLVVVDGEGTPAIDAVLDSFTGEPRLRVVRHPVNRGIAEAYNTIVREGRGELIAMLGDDDVCLPDRISRQVAAFDAAAASGEAADVIHGDAVIIDEHGNPRGRWPSAEFTPGALHRHLVRVHNPLIDPTRMIHRRVYDAIGGYRAQYTLAQDFDFWLRAVPHFRFRHVAGEPLIRLRRHGENFSDESSRAKEVEQVEMALLDHLERHDLRELVPELDWPVLHPDAARRRALELLADALDARALPLPALATRLRRRAREIVVGPRGGWGPAAGGRDSGTPRRGRLMMTAFGWNDSGGGTTVPRVAAKELVRRGWEVTVFHAATRPDPSGLPYAVREWEEDGVRLIGVHNRAHGLWDLGRPDRELDDPPITEAFAAAMDRLRPDVVHFHNLHNLGAALMDVAAARGVPSYFTTHNYWLVCPRAYLLRGDGALCDGPGNAGADCASCVGSHDTGAHARRLAGIRERFARSITKCLAVSEGVAATLVNEGYDPAAIDVVRQGVPAQGEVWERVGRDRVPGRLGDVLTVGFFGSAFAHKGPHLLVEAAQRVEAPIRVRIHGEVPEAMRTHLEAIDRRGIAEICGSFSPDELPGLLARVDAAALPSVWWDCAPLAAAECLAARVPVLAPRMGGLAEAITHDVDGLSFAGGDVEDLAAQLQRLASEEGLLERLQAGIAPPRPFATYVDELEAIYDPATFTLPADKHEAAAAGHPITVRWRGDFDRPTSLAAINREVVSRLTQDDGFAVQRLRLNAGENGAPLLALDAPLPHVADVEVRHAWPPKLDPPAAGRLALVQPWEWGALPAAWAEPILDHVDEVWAPTEYVARQYLDIGMPADRVHVVPNGVDLDRVGPEGPALEGMPTSAARFLFVGGALSRKGLDVLVAAWSAAFPAGDEDVSLVIKDFGGDSVYRKGDRTIVRELAERDPRVLHLTRTLSEDEVAALYRSADVLVHPYRGEGFGMPILEAMASALPVIVTAGGAADEFCPPAAGWRVRAERKPFPTNQVGEYETFGTPWELEPDPGHLAGLLRKVAASPDEWPVRGAVGRATAQAFSWDAVAGQYAGRIAALAARPPKLGAPAAAAAAAASAPAAGEAGAEVLATPAWRGEDRLDDLLSAWSLAGGAATLVLLADPAVDGTPEEIEARVLDAAARAGVDLEHCPDVTIRVEPGEAGRDARAHAQSMAYVSLHAACAGHERLARVAGNPVIGPDSRALREVLGAAAGASDAILSPSGDLASPTTSGAPR